MRTVGHVRFIRLIAAATFALWAQLSLAQDPYPSRLVKIVVPAAAGSTTDSAGAHRRRPTGADVGKSVIVENIAGGAMNVGASSVARAAPDGYTLMVAPPAPLSFNDLLVPRPRICADPIHGHHAAGENPEHPGRPQGLSGRLAQRSHRLCQSQSGQALLRVAGRRLDRASLREPARSSGAASRWCTCPIAARCPRSPTSSPATSTCSSTRSRPRCRSIATTRSGFWRSPISKRAGARAGDTDLLGSGLAGVSIDHLVRPGGAAEHARSTCRQDQSRRGRDCSSAKT